MFQTPLLLLLITSTSLALSLLSLESVLSPNFPRVATSLSRSLSVVVPPPPSPGLPPTTHATRATFPLHQKPTHNLLTHSSQPYPMDSDFCDECIFCSPFTTSFVQGKFFKRLALIAPLSCSLPYKITTTWRHLHHHHLGPRHRHRLRSQRTRGRWACLLTQQACPTIPAC